jgi:hypothetical protein
MVSLGEAGELSPNASAMLRISTLSAWAQLQVSTSQQSYLEAVVNPHRKTLASLWVAALRDYASIRVDTESLSDTSSVAIDSSYSSLGKEVLLPVSIPHVITFPCLLCFHSTIRNHGLLYCKPLEPQWTRVTQAFWQQWMVKKLIHPHKHPKNAQNLLLSSTLFLALCMKLWFPHQLTQPTHPLQDKFRWCPPCKH